MTAATRLPSGTGSAGAVSASAEDGPRAPRPPHTPAWAARRRRAAGALLAVLAGLAAAALLGACGSGPGQLTVSVAAASGADVRSGDAPTYTVTVVNKGPGPVSGVTVRVDLPAGFAYSATPSITGVNVARTQPLDPEPRTQQPTWGQWSLSSPGTDAQGAPQDSRLDIQFTASAGGAPGAYQIVPHVGTDSGPADDTGTPIAVRLVPAAQLAVRVDAVPPAISPGEDVVYHVTVSNSGTGPAAGVGVFVTLPPSVTFTNTVELSGNASRSGGTSPTSGSLLVLYDGWTIPAAGGGQPGQAVMVFRAHCQSGAAGGRFAVTVQLLDSAGTVQQQSDAAPLAIEAPTATP